MGMYDSLFLRCPVCNGQVEFQSKSGNNECDEFTAMDVPLVILYDIVYCGVRAVCGCGVTVVLSVEPIRPTVDVMVIDEEV